MDDKMVVEELNNVKNDTSISFENREIRIKILETFLTISNKHKQLTFFINDFFEKYHEIEYDENDFYFDSENLNDIRIFIKGKILESDICEELRRRNIETFTPDELCKYIILYEEKEKIDLDNLKRGVEIYYQLENVFSLIAEEKNIIYSELINNFLHIGVDSSKINEYFANKGQQIVNLIKDKENKKILNEFTYNCCLYLINIFYSLLDYY